jgi:hypothetical protein
MKKPKPSPSMHFHDVEKNADIARDIQAYQGHLDKITAAFAWPLPAAQNLAPVIIAA